MRTSVETLEGNHIKLTVEVDDEEVSSAEDETVGRLTKSARIPGFRPGKVPRRIIEARLGRRGIREEALREVLPKLYGDAVRESELDVIAPPEIDITAGEESGPVAFAAVVEVRPKVAIPGYEGLVVTVPAPTVTEDDIDAQVNRLREQFATLTEVGRPARSGDLVTLDVHGSRSGAPAEGLVADDLVYEVGTGGIVKEADANLEGAKAGDIFEIDAEDAPGGPAQLRILVKQVREKVLPEANDDFAGDASEFDTLADLRADIETHLSNLKVRQSSGLLRLRALDALADLVTDEMPTTLVANEAQRLLDDFLARLTAQQITLDAYLQATGSDQQTMFNEFEAQASRDVRSDLALRALAEAQVIEVDESEIDDEIVHLAQHAQATPAVMRATLERGGNLAGLRSQIRNAKALRWLVDHVDVVDEEGKPVDRSMLVDEGGSSHDHAESESRQDVEEESA